MKLKKMSRIFYRKYNHMIDKNIQDYSDALKDLDIENQIVEHTQTKDYREILTDIHIELSDCVPTLILKADNHFIAVVFRADSRVNFKKIKKLLDVKDVRMATPEEFIFLTKLPIGAARVYNPGMKTILDKKVFEKEYLMGGSGNFSCSIKYKTDDLRKIPENIVADITKS